MQNSSARQNESQTSSDALLIIVMILVLIGIIWVALHSKISGLLLSLREIELILPAVVSQNAAMVLGKLRNTDPASLSMGGLGLAMTESGRILMWIFAPLTFLLAIFNYLQKSPNSFKRRHSMDSLMEQEAKIWPTIAPVVKEPTGTKTADILKGKWASAMTEREFADHHQLIYRIPESPIFAYARRNSLTSLEGQIETEKLVKHLVTGSIHKYGESHDLATKFGFLDDNGSIDEHRTTEYIKQINENQRKNGHLNLEKALAVFRLQLGSRWQGFSGLTPYMRGILACLMVRALGARTKEFNPVKEADELSARMALDYADNGPEKMDFSWADAYLQKYCEDDIFKTVLLRHAYVYTVFASMMQLARNARNPGVFASAQFKWIKPIDRRLWYTLNNVGRHAFHVECAGIMAHWLMEKSIGEGIDIPCVEHAVSHKETIVTLDANGRKIHTEKLVGGLEFALTEYCDDDRENRIYD